MSILFRLFGAGTALERPKGGEYKDFRNYPEPQREGTTYRLQARVTKIVGGVEKEHVLIRADTLESEDAAAEAGIRKAKQVIDEQGERLFG